jgi:hypothetical protein
MFSIYEAGELAMFHDDMEYLLDTLESAILKRKRPAGKGPSEQDSKQVLMIGYDIIRKATLKPGFISCFASKDYVPRIMMLLGSLTGDQSDHGVLSLFALLMHSCVFLGIRVGSHISLSDSFFRLCIALIDNHKDNDAIHDMIHGIPRNNISEGFQSILSSMSDPTMVSIECIYLLITGNDTRRLDIIGKHLDEAFFLQFFKIFAANLDTSRFERCLYTFTLLYTFPSCSKTFREALISNPSVLLLLYDKIAAYTPNVASYTKIKTQLLAWILNLSNDRVIGKWISSSILFNSLCNDLEKILAELDSIVSIDHILLLIAILCNVYEQYTSIDCYASFYNIPLIPKLLAILDKRDPSFIDHAASDISSMAHNVLCSYLSLLLARILLGSHQISNIDQSIYISEYHALLNSRTRIRNCIETLVELHQEDYSEQPNLNNISPMQDQFIQILSELDKLEADVSRPF